jgi:hypothetical protein
VTGSGRTRRLVFRARCAKRLHASFATNAGQTMVLGSGTAAPTPTLSLVRPASNGVEGRVIHGPTCPVERPTGCPIPAKPAPGNVRIKTVATDSDGRFSTTLDPGTYSLTPDQPRGKPTVVDVAGGVISDVTLVVDTGIR